VALTTLVLADPLDLAPLDAALARLPAGYDGVLFTSTNTVDRVARRLAAAGRSLAAATRGIRVGVSGPATAEALEAQGVSVDLIPDRSTSEGLLERMEDVSNTRWLLPRAERARPVLPDGLRALGATVDIVTAYRTVPPRDPSEVRAALATGLDAITFASGSAVRNLADLVVGELAEALRGVAVVSIGPVTSAACREYGLEPIEAAEARIDALARAALAG
jgi:uroporphyrinogen-III synthase